MQESVIAVERAGVRLLPKPWGSLDLRPWNARDVSGGAVGEIWFQRGDPDAPEPALLLKLLFANEPLSIQVHPDDDFARSIGLPRGKTEAWYILSAAPGAKVALGLKHDATAKHLRASIEDGSIADLVRWREVHTGEVIFVPAGTIHAIGPGLVIAEIQQTSDATFRMFDFGRGRELHADNAVAVAIAGPALAQPAPVRLNDARTLLIASPCFVLERIDLAPGSDWEIDGSGETWLLVIDGGTHAGEMTLSTGEALFLQADRVTIRAGGGGLSCLAAYQGPDPRPRLLRSLAEQKAESAAHTLEAQP